MTPRAVPVIGVVLPIVSDVEISCGIHLPDGSMFGVSATDTVARVRDRYPKDGSRVLRCLAKPEGQGHSMTRTDWRASAGQGRCAARESG